MTTNTNWNIQGIFIPETLSLEKIKNTFKLRKFSLQTKISIGRALSEYFEKRNFAVIHCENGTVLLHDDTATNDELLKSLSQKMQILTCYVNSMTGAYCFDLFENGMIRRSSWNSVAQPEICQDKGNVLEWENKEDKLNTIFGGIKSILQEDIRNAEYEVSWYLQQK